MSHARTISPSFFTDEELAELPFKTRLWFAGLWCQADREGRLEEKLKELKANIMPHDDVSPEKMLQLLSKPKKYSNKPFIYRYKINDKRYIQILEFHKHQKPHNTEANSAIPLSTDVYSMLYNIDKKDRKHRAGQLELVNGWLTVRKPLEILKGLKLYENYAQLLKRLPEMIPIWKQSCPGVDIELEIKKAHAWELENTKKRKIDKIKFLGAWMRRCQDRGSYGQKITNHPKGDSGKYEKYK